MKYVTILLLILFTLQSTIAQKQVAICWDASFSMKDRKLDRELQYLDDYFKKNEITNVKLLIFSNTVILQESYKVNGGDWNSLKQVLQATIYDGANSYNVLFKEPYDEYLLFTDGVESLDKLKPPPNKPVYVISSLNKSGITSLNLGKDLSSVSYVYLDDEFIQPEIQSSIKQINSEINKGRITGLISGKDGPLVGVTIFNKTIRKGVISGLDGNYSIEADEGDELTFSYLGKKTISIKVLNTNTINITMEYFGESLGEVVVKSSLANKEDDRVMTANGLKNKEAVGYAVQTIKNEEFVKGARSLKQAVEGKVVGVKIKDNADLSAIQIRNGGLSLHGNTKALFIVDGAPISGVNISNFVTPDNVADFTVLKGLAATNRYGQAGNNGVVIITTKTGSGGQGKNRNTALLTNNVYKEKINKKSEALFTQYLKELKSKKTIDEAYQIYLDQRHKYAHISEYFIDVFDLFKMSNKKKAIQILSNLLEIEEATLMQLRTALFKLQQQREYDLALVFVKRINEVYPNKIQSHVDLAIAYKDARHFQESLDLLNNIINGNTKAKLDFSGLEKTINREMRSLIFKHRKQLNLSKVDSKYLNVYPLDARIIVEWANEEDQFELQFVNPSKRFFKWKHSQIDSQNRLKDELENGYSKEEFEIDGAGFEGKWLINVKYLGNGNLNENMTSFIKCAVYYNFGKPNQKREEHILRLQKKGSEEMLATIVIK